MNGFIRTMIYIDISINYIEPEKKIKIQPNVQIQTSYSTYLDRKTSSGVLCINVSDHFPVLHIHDLRNKNSDCKKVYSNIEISVINKRH